MRELKIPVSASFEKRLAELVWENCPELARSTAAGKIALALEVEEHVLQGIVIENLKETVIGWIQEQLPAFKEKVLAHVNTDTIAEEFADDIRAYVRQQVDNTDIAREARMRLQSAIQDELQNKLQPAVTEYFGSNNESLPAIIQARIDAYLERKFGGPEAHEAIANGMHRMVASAEQE